jgi:hypothetical protein
MRRGRKPDSSLSLRRGGKPDYPLSLWERVRVRAVCTRIFD